MKEEKEYQHHISNKSEENMNELIDLKTDVIEASKNKPILVDFWAEWCGPCKVLSPILEKLEKEADYNWTLVKINTDLQPDLAAQYGVMGIPTVKLFINGEIIDQFVGALPENRVKQWLDNHLSVQVQTKSMVN